MQDHRRKEVNTPASDKRVALCYNISQSYAQVNNKPSNRGVSKIPNRVTGGLLRVGNIVTSGKIGTGKFVVEEAGLNGRLEGEDLTGGNVGYCIGWRVSARCLADDGSFDPEGKVVSFRMSGPFAEVIEPYDVTVIGKMNLAIHATR